MPPGPALAGTDRCPRCDSTFGCGIATGACWCAETPRPKRLTELAVPYDGCLCPRCLDELALTTEPDPRRVH